MNEKNLIVARNAYILEYKPSEKYLT